MRGKGTRARPRSRAVGTRSIRTPRVGPAVLAAAALAAGGFVAPLAAQDVDAGPGTPVSGTVYDSIHGRPLARATVEALGTGVRTLTDARGHFTFTLPPGRHVLGFSHAQVAAWPALVHERAVDVGRAPVVANVATASEATVVARTCGGGGAVVGGVVRDMLTRVPVARAVVEISGAVGGSREELGRIPTALDGSFQLCVGALPPGGVELEARIGSVRSRTVSIETGAVRVVATDLNVLVSEPARISGVLVDGEDARPVADAMVRVDGTRLGARSDGDGTFLLRGVPPGAVTLAVEHVRYGRRTTEILAESGDSVHVEFELRAEAIPLEELVVRVTRASTAARDRTGTRFDALDRDDIDRLLERSQGFSGLRVWHERAQRIERQHPGHDGHGRRADGMRGAEPEDGGLRQRLPDGRRVPQRREGGQRGPVPVEPPARGHRAHPRGVAPGGRGPLRRQRRQVRRAAHLHAGKLAGCLGRSGATSTGPETFAAPHQRTGAEPPSAHRRRGTPRGPPRIA